MPLLDEFPCQVTIGGETFQDARVLESGGQAFVFVYDPEAQAPRLVDTARLVTPVEPRRTLTGLDTDKGRWDATKNGCVCRKPLGRYSRWALLESAGVSRG